MLVEEEDAPVVDTINGIWALLDVPVREDGSITCKAEFAGHETPRAMSLLDFRHAAKHHSRHGPEGQLRQLRSTERA